jgi:hypothetical protein
MTVEKPTQKQTYDVGGFYGFKTSPFTRYSPPETNRFAALKVLGVGHRGVVYVVLDGIFDRMPTLEQLAQTKPLRCRRFLFKGRTALHCSPQEWDNDLLELRHIATLPLSADDLALAATNNSYGLWSGASTDAEGEWRWAHDREVVESEVRQANADRDAKLAADRLRYENRLKRLCWDMLLAETPFERWNRHPPFPPPEFVTAARERVRNAVLDLRALGARPRKTAVRAVLKSCVQWFNEQDRAFNGVIETEEREDICRVLLELAVVARHRSLAEEVDNWREW